MAPVTVTVLDDVRAFLEQARHLLVREPVVHSVVATNAARVARDPGSDRQARWFLLHRDQELVGVAMHTPPHPLHLPLVSPALAVAVARERSRTGADVPGVSGLREGVLAFSDWWCAEHDLDADVDMDQGIYDLPGTPRLSRPVEGRLRVAVPDDLDLVQGWLEDFVREATSGHLAPDAAPHVLEGRTALWEKDGRPVSMCYASLPSGGVTRISGVWTPPAERGHGYASAVVAGWSAHQQQAGLRCMLYTDLANPTSNGIYQEIGYRRIGDSLVLRFSDRLSG